MKELQFDEVSYLYRLFRPVLHALRDASLSLDACQLRTDLLAWDGNSAIGSREATVWNQWYRTLLSLPRQEVNRSTWDQPMYLQQALLSNGSSLDTACKLRQPESSNCIWFAEHALEGVASEYASLVDAPRWGIDVHPALFPHQVLTNTPFRCFADCRAEHGGDRSTVNVGSMNDQFEMIHGASYRQVLDLSNLSASEFVFPPGQSGAPFSQNYRSLLLEWQNGQYLPFPWVGAD
jgi:penicillin amidase